MTAPEKPYRVEPTSNASKEQKRVVFVTSSSSAQVRRSRTQHVMSFPDLLMGELTILMLVVIVLTVCALLFNAPLEELADPDHTPNPAKAPWYFVGLQELLHYFHPIVAGVILPTVVIIALIVIPYFKVNIDRQPLWERRSGVKTSIVLGAVISISVLLMYFHVWPVLIASWSVWGIALVPLLWPTQRRGFVGWLMRKSLADWIMTWFVVVATTLTMIGTLFRGPEWSWVWPW